MNNNVQLLKIKEENLLTIMNWRMSESVTKYMFTDPQLTLEGQRNWLKSITNNPTCYYWVICFNDVPIGLIGINNIEDVCGDLSIYIGNNEYRGKGIAETALNGMMQYLYSKSIVSKIISDVFDENKDAIHLYKKCGFVESPDEAYKIEKSGKEHLIRRYIAIGNHDNLYSNENQIYIEE